MKCLFLTAALLVLSEPWAEAHSTLPFKASEVTVDFGQKRAAKFFYHGFKGHFSPDHATIPKVERIEFTFSNGNVAKIPKSVCDQIHILDPSIAMIESGPANGEWFLTVRIKNIQNLTKRIANDWAVLVFTEYKFERFWLERNKQRKAKITINEKAARETKIALPPNKKGTQ